jgi:Metal binding domain of Ada
MTGFAAVATTGIYCRPGCAARPSPQNVRQFLLAAAAEAAGYRACLRCRPYRAEPPVSWSGPELVCRAVQLILDGALDGKTEHDLAGRLFVSVRHLRRLFNENLGVTPDQLARSSCSAPAGLSPEVTSRRKTTSAPRTARVRSLVVLMLLPPECRDRERLYWQGDLNTQENTNGQRGIAGRFRPEIIRGRTGFKERERPRQGRGEGSMQSSTCAM